MNKNISRLNKVILAGVILTLAFVLCACNLFQTVEEAEKEQSGGTYVPPIVDIPDTDDSNSGNDTEDDVIWLDEFVNVTIECLSLIEPDINSKVPANFKQYIPEDGYILKNVRVQLIKGDTAYSVLYRTCKGNNIDIRASYSAIYDSYYVESINFLKEKMMDKITNRYSGWIYKVNDVSPNYGMSGYEVKDLDNLVYFYTC